MSHFSSLSSHRVQINSSEKKIKLIKNLSSARLSRSLRPRRRSIRRRPCRTLNTLAYVLCAHARARVCVCTKKKKKIAKEHQSSHTHSEEGKKGKNEGHREKRNNKQRNKTIGHSKRRVFLPEGNIVPRETPCLLHRRLQRRLQ